MRTRRLILSPLHDDDATDIAALYRDPRVTRLLREKLFPSIAHARELCVLSAQFNDQFPGLGLWSVRMAATDEFCGIVSFNPLRELGGVQLGVVLNQAAWSLRLVPDFGDTILRYAFEALKLRRLLSLPLKENRAAEFWLRSYGFNLKSDLDCVDGTYSLLVLTRERWHLSQESADYRILRVRAKRALASGKTAGLAPEVAFELAFE